MKKKEDSIHFDRKKNKFIGVNQVVLEELENSYPGIDLRKEFVKMCEWLKTKGQKRRGNIAFIKNWLNRVSPYTTTQEKVEFKVRESPLKPYILEHAVALWKGKENLFQYHETTTFR